MNKLISLVLLTLISLTGHANISSQTTFDATQLHVQEKTIGQDKYCVLNYDGLYNSGIVGAPELPVKYMYFVVPSNSSNYQIKFQSSTADSISIDNPLYLIEDETLGQISNEVPQPFWTKYPEENVKIIGAGFCGDTKVVTVEIIPVTYQRGSSKINFLKEINFEINFNESEDETLSFCSSSDRQLAIEKKDQLKKIVENSEALNQDAGTPLTLQPVTKYDYIIITPSRFCKAFTRLAAIRRTRGYGANVFSLEQILSTDEYLNKTGVEEINDDAGRLRAFIRYAYMHFSTKHVLLAGRYPELPTRIANTYSPSKLPEYNPPTDFYFAELNNIWEYNINSDSYRIASKTPDFFNELSIGRIGVTSEDDINRYIDRVKLYEFNPGNGDRTYLSRGFKVIQDGDYTIESHFKQTYNDIPFNGVKISDKDDYNGLLTGAEVIKRINQTPAVYIDIIGHGNIGGIGVGREGSGHYGVVGLDANESWHIPEAGNGLDNLTVDNYPSWMYNISCHVIPFDYIEDSGTPSTLGYNFGDAYTFMNKSGGVALLGNTRESICFHENNQMIYFYDKLRELYADKNQKEYITAAEMCSLLWTGSYTSHLQTKLIRNIYGDPLCPLWQSGIKTLPMHRITNDSINNLYYVGVDSNSRPLRMATTELGGSVLSSQTTVTRANQNINVKDNTLVTCYGKNSLPLILPLTITNFAFDGSTLNYIFAKKVTIGNDEYGKDNVFIWPQNIITIEAMADVEVKNGLYIQANSTLNILSDKDVYLSNVHMGENAILNVIADNVYYDKGFVLNDGNFTVNITERNKPAQSRKRTMTRRTEYQPMVVEGRTWWYKNGSGNYFVEFGLSIGSEVERMGKMWHKVYLKLYRKTTGTPEGWQAFDENTGLIGYMREEDGKVYASIDQKDLENESVPKSGVGSLEDCGYFDSALMYDFNFDNNKFVIDLVFHQLRGTFDVLNEDEIESCGRTYRRIEANTQERPLNYRGYWFVEGIGLIDPEHYGLIIMPFQEPIHHAAKIDYFPMCVTYVTDANNEVIFEGEGGIRLWEAYSGIDDIYATASSSPSATINGNTLEINGITVNDVAVFTTTGLCVAHCKNACVQVDHLSSGVYIVRVNGSITLKVVK